MIVHHIAVTTAEGYLTRRQPYRQANLEYLMALRARGVMIAGGPAPDGRTCDLFCRTGRPEDVGQLVEGSPFFSAGLWTGYAARSFAQFVEPWEASPPRPDETRIASIVEGAALDPEMAAFALIEARGAGHMVLGGVFPDGASLAVMRMAEPADAVELLDQTGVFTPGSLLARPLVHVL